MTSQSTESKQTVNGITFELEPVLRGDDVAHIWSATNNKRTTTRRAFGHIEATPNADGMYYWTVTNFAIPRYVHGTCTTIAAAMRVCAAAMKAVRS